MKKIVIICGGPSSEHEVSINSTKSCLKSINKDKYDISVFYIAKELKGIIFKTEQNDFAIPASNTLNDFFEEAKKLKNYDLSLLMLHGEFGEDGAIQTILDLYNVKYSGSNPFASRLCMDKDHTNQVVKHLKKLYIPKTKKFLLKNITEEYLSQNIPIVVKPNRLGSSVGVQIIKKQTEIATKLAQLKEQFKGDDEFLVQEMIDGIEISCGCLEQKDGKMIELPPIEIQPQISGFFDYKAKYQQGGSKEICPPENLSSEISAQVSQLAAQIHQKLGCKTYSRSDFIVSEDKICYLETNTLPGMTATSLLPQEAAARGINFSSLLDFLIENS
jgi:D-alanine-D-alanine ligase